VGGYDGDFYCATTCNDKNLWYIYSMQLRLTTIRNLCAFHCLNTTNFVAIFEMVSQGCQIKRMAAELKISRTAVVLALDAMEFAGLLVKTRATEGDKRRAVVTLTGDGTKLLDDIQQIFAQSTSS